MKLLTAARSCIAKAKTPRQLSLCMKFTTIFLLASALNAGAKGFGQTVTLSTKNALLVDVFSEIRKQTGYDFLFKSSWMHAAKPVTVSVKKLPVNETLLLIFKEQTLTYQIVEKTVIIKPNSDTSISDLTSNPIDVQGQVVNEKGYPVEGVTVTVKESDKTTLTNVDGKFSLSTVDRDATLIFTHVNMEKFELKVSGKTELIIKLKTKTTELGDVTITVSTGYQDIPKERATGSFSKLDNAALNQQVGTNIVKRLDGITSAILFDTKQPQPQKKTNISIRGFSSINGPLDPLIVLDGFIYEGNIDNINPNFIDNISILKDAAAASIWGARASNGVIVITTKKGQYNQKDKIEFNATVMINQKPDVYTLPILSSSDYIDLEEFRFNKGLMDDQISNYPFYALTPATNVFLKRRNGLLSSADSASLINALKSQDVRDDYTKYYLTNAITQQYNVGLRGGNNKNAYSLSLGYDKTRREDYGQFNKINIGIENAFTPNKRLQATIGAYYANSKSESGRPGKVVIDGKPVPYLKFTDKNGSPIPLDIKYNGSYTDTMVNGKLLDWKYYPLEDYKHNTNSTSLQEVLFNAGLNYKLAKYLTLDFKYQFQKQQIEGVDLQDQESFQARNVINGYSQIDQTTGSIKYIVPLGGIRNNKIASTQSQTGRVQFNLNKSWGDHNIVGILGGEIREVVNNNSTNTTYGYSPEPLLSGAVDYTNQYPHIITGENSFIEGAPSYSKIVDRFISAYSNVAYSFKNKYTFSLSSRKDGSNIFGANTNDKWKPLWSAGMAWTVSNEYFYNSTFLPFLKIRGTYGYGGNVDLSKSALPVSKYVGTNPFTNFPVSRIIVINNPELRWEKVRTLNIGIDFSTAKQVISGSIEFYHKKGSDLYGPTEYDYSTWGFTQYVTKNVAEMKGEGVEVNLTSKNIDKAFKWRTNYFFTYTNNKISAYNTKESTQSSQLLFGGESITPVIGKPLYAIAAYKWGGLDSLGNPQGYVNGKKSIDYTEIEKEATTKGTGGNITYLGSTIPTVFGSIINTFSWEQISLSINVSYKFNYYFRKQALSYTEILNGGEGHSDFNKRWVKPGDENHTTVPSFIYPNIQQRDIFYSRSEVNVLKGDHIRLNYINLSYSFEDKLSRKLKINDLQIYMNVSNLGILWRANKEHLDPEYSSIVQPTKSFSFGIRAAF